MHKAIKRKSAISVLTSNSSFNVSLNIGLAFIQRWRARQLLMVGIYIAPCLALALGLSRIALSGGYGLLRLVIDWLSFLTRLDAAINDFSTFLTFSGW